MKKMSTTERLEAIRPLAGTMPGKELAKQVGMTYGSLCVFCSKHSISLAFAHKRQTTKTGRKAAAAKAPAPAKPPAVEKTPKKAPAVRPAPKPQPRPQLEHPTPEQEKQIHELAGTIPAEEVARQVALRPSILREYCAKREISLRYIKPKTDPAREKLLPQVELLETIAGTMRQIDIAAQFDVSVPALRRFCQEMDIDLTLLPGVKAQPAVNLDAKVEEASRLLRSQGWKVLRPDPFRTLIDEPRQCQRGPQRQGASTT